MSSTPPSSDAYKTQLDLAESREEAGDLAGAERILGALIEREPEPALAYDRRGTLRLFEREDHAGALSDLTQAEARGIASFGVPSPQLDDLIGEALFGLEGYADAASRLRKAAEALTDPVVQAESYDRLAECSDELEREDEVRSALSAFLARREAFLESGRRRSAGRVGRGASR